MNFYIKATNLTVALRQFSSTAKPKLKVVINNNVYNNIEQASYKPRKHPGISTVNTVTVPEDIVSAIQNVLEDYPVKKLLKDADVMSRHLKGRVPPMEAEQIQEMRDQFYAEIAAKEEEKLKGDEACDQDIDKLNQSVKDKVIHRLKKKVYNWTPMSYDAYNSLVYMMARFPVEYAVLVKIFDEIHHRDQNFKPKSMFDFGSGTGTAMWASNKYFGNMFEYFNVDTSPFMNNLSQLLRQGGRANKTTVLKNVFYRQFLPQNNRLYDIVVCAYTLMEMHSVDARMKTILNLWNKTGQYLIIVEQGTNAGFKIINEMRDYILELSKTNDNNMGHVFSPCAHDLTCPRFTQDDTPCNFQINYNTMPLGMKPVIKSELYSYVILRKGAKNKTDEAQWPRIVRETLVRPRHTICRTCTKDGNLEELIFTSAKHGKITYHCARASKWGDRLPIEISNEEDHVQN